MSFCQLRQNPKIFIERNHQKINNEGTQKIFAGRKQAMHELEGSGGFPNKYLKKQTTNDRSAPYISGDNESNK